MDIPITTDLEVIEKVAKEREDENWRFRSYLKGYDTDEVDAIIHRLYEEIAPQIDCQACGNCCRAMHPILKDGDVEHLSAHLGISDDELTKQYLAEDDDGDTTFNAKPCPFLEDNSCSVYEARPKDCRSYPHLHKKDIVCRLMGVVFNCSVCPIVFNVYEQMKQELWFSRGYLEDDD
ncbi:YkgJ family cysteine cluster protein [Pontiellaceae bacterium B12227]|nr:YkgJ family cysteine cluster protein [Pontiellaceae bacterium B12227]